MTKTHSLWFGRAAGRKTALHFSWLRSLPAKTLTGAIHFYRRFLSPLLPPGCRFQPTCSIYALEAIAMHGAGRGTVLAIKRLLRCHPISWLGGSSGFDPVPPAKSQHP